jgi:hypothetical protein
MKLPGTYTLDTESIRLNAYRLLCLFYANKEIARLSDPADRDDSASRLERSFFSREMTHLLLGIAIGLRVLDDQMLALPTNSATRQKYLLARDAVNRHPNCMMFDSMTLREVCNKIIHAIVVEPHDHEVTTGSHDIDHRNWLGWSDVVDLSSREEAGPEPEPIQWNHLTGHIRLGGQLGGKSWWHLLDVPIFVDTINDLIEASA